MEIPIYIDGKRAGTLTLRRGSCAAELDARLEDPGRVVRLRVFGEREFYLGVPVREGDGLLRLTRRLTPSEARRFPQKPAYAAETPLRPGAPEPPREKEEETCRRVLWHGGQPHYF